MTIMAALRGQVPPCCREEHEDPYVKQETCPHSIRGYFVEVRKLNLCFWIEK